MLSFWYNFRVLLFLDFPSFRVLILFSIVPVVLFFLLILCSLFVRILFTPTFLCYFFFFVCHCLSYGFRLLPSHCSFLVRLVFLHVLLILLSERLACFVFFGTSVLIFFFITLHCVSLVFVLCVREFFHFVVFSFHLVCVGEFAIHLCWICRALSCVVLRLLGLFTLLQLVGVVCEI